ncbi:hypothetical protein DFQ27_001103 [Actinomortierella ambigua]|uniref:Uncharacterized protein n=1 Tax=Actinomortierella ambigua TaxID=1343610 RepID=A0A9P6U981_9FUNG|nr:hypothetical protein DFQ27_001103 [Actinomortierella ambigua]
MASTASTDVLETAMVTTVTQSKTTPQVMRLNTIKRDKSDLIQRSNSLHSNNSLRRTKSQRKLAQAREKTKSPLASRRRGGDKDSNDKDDDDHNDTAAGQPRWRQRRPSADSAHSNTTATTSDSESDGDNEAATTTDGRRCDGNDAGSPFRDRRDSVEYTPAVMVTGPSARSSVRSTGSGPGGGVSRPRSPTMVLGPLPIGKQYPAAATTASANSTSTIVVSPMHIPGSANTTTTITTTTPTAPTSTAVASPFKRDSSNIHEEYDDDDDPLSLLDIQGAHRLRPWARGSMASSGTRDSTFSTASDARSSTRGDGEEIMIFWDGHRNSTRSSVHHEF